MTVEKRISRAVPRSLESTFNLTTSQWEPASGFNSMLARFATQSRGVIPSQAWTIGLTGLLSLSPGCSLTLPVAIESFEATRHAPVTSTTARPELVLHLHPDGLGWQAHVTQRITLTTHVDANERRRDRAYEVSGRTPAGQADTYDDLCAIAMGVTPLFAPFDLDNPPYWAKFDHFFDRCQQAAQSTRAVRTIVRHEHFREEVRTDMAAVTQGHLSLSWQASPQEPVQLIIPLETNIRDQGVPVRLRWLAEILRRQGRTADEFSHGKVELSLVQNGHLIIHHPLSLSGNELAASLRDDRVSSTPPGRWPSPLIIRIERAPLSLDLAERRDLAAHATALFARHAIPVVARGEALAELQAQQVIALQPAYAETLAPSVAEWTGATALLYIDVHQPYAHSRLISLRLLDVTTGELLALVTTGGHDSQWKFLVETVLKQLEAVVLPVLDRPRPRTVSQP